MSFPIRRMKANDAAGLPAGAIKAAAEKFPFRFVTLKKVAKKDGDGWSEEEF